MPTDTTTASELMKRAYNDGEIQNLQNMVAETWPTVKKSSRKVGGEGYFGLAHTSGNQRGQGAQNENEALRDPGTQGTKQWKIYPKIFTHLIRYSGLSLEMASGGENSFAEILTFNNDNGFKDLTKELNAECYRDGSGKIAQVNGAVVATNVINFNNGVPTHFREGTYIDVINGSGVKQVDSKRIGDIDVSAKTVTLLDEDGAAINVSCDDDAYIYRENVADGLSGNNASGKELSGKPLIADDGTLSASFENIVRSGTGAIPKWRGFTLSLSGQNVSNDALQRGVSRMKILSGTSIKKIVSNESQFRKYLDLVVPAIRFKKGEKMDSGYTEVPSWNGYEWVRETDCGFGDIFFEDDDWFQKYEVRPMRLDDTDGKTIKWDNGFDCFISYIKTYVNTGTENPRKGLRETGYNEPTF